jgi:antitoxin component HigA of HigAB toxin-antitoxin module
VTPDTPIRSKRDYQAALKEVERLWGAKVGTREGDRLDVLATLIDAYETEHYSMDPPDQSRRSSSAWSNKGSLAGT